MRRSGYSLILVLLPAALFASTVFAATVVKEVRLSATSDATRVVFDLSQAAAPVVFALSDPDRIVFDIPGAHLNGDSLPEGRGLVKSLRAADRGNGVLRVVIDVAGAVTTRSFAVEPNEVQGHRWVLDLLPAGAKTASAPTAMATSTVEPQLSKPTVAITSSTSTTAASKAPNAELRVLKSAADAQEGRDLVIAIDAGHGGEDPGAIGKRGTREKDITLAIARKIKARIDAEPGMRAVLTRDADVFVPLRERIQRARQRQADLFISIHADAVNDRHVSGSSVYVLSARGASNEATRWLAESENAVDLIGGVSLDDKDNVLASVLLDLSQGASMSASITAADKMLAQLDHVGDVLHTDVKQAGFVVLKSPDIPSMLIETAFISNPAEEARLRDVGHQQKLAEAVTAGVRSYFYDNPPPGTRIAQLRAQQRKPAASRDRASSGAVIAGGLSP
ncbi:MAG: N-acetylmuramoyl-L-alanine amidase [Candidatus Obscuribacterales bacterium]|nr:N-acetylmuramoyl-L-alanine amidase [Steroidobacteraceae bacterium]